MSRKRALTQKELQDEMDRIMENMSDESSQSEDNDDSVADSNYEPSDDDTSESSDINSTSSPVPAQYTNNSDDELSGNSSPNSPLPGSSAASVPTQNTDTDNGLADNAASDNMIWRFPTSKQPVLLPFTKQTGTEPHLAELLCEELLEMFFFSLVDDPIFQYIVDQTNRYATQVITSEADVPVVNLGYITGYPQIKMKSRKFLACSPIWVL
ncbi:clumping factor A-like [Anthonomus grandis grandis]|uniref:clumping factor A-like n=1 Tax=Anthonomus grandis grandis TaxID=2921223 RepID=UPI002166418E|nr:clumping factor A-like [Anthonomus grandis grandis]